MSGGARVMGWQTASTDSGSFVDAVPSDAELDWQNAELPVRGSDDDDHWFRARFAAEGETSVLALPGLATLCDVYLDGVHVLRTDSMFIGHRLPVPAGDHELAICARALAPVLAESRRPRARWRTRVVANGNLRWIRTTLFGRAPGFAPPPAVVGPWQPVEVLEREPPAVTLRTYVDGRDGVIEVRCPAVDGPVEVSGGFGTVRLPAGGGHVQVPAPALWWPHTHGDPALHPVCVRTDAGEVSRRIGFRRLLGAARIDEDGLDLHVNGIPVFARGVVWTPVDTAQLRPTLERLRDAGMNMIRVVGTAQYESDEFHDLCDELGLLVWQDLMFANLDYPFADPSFAELVEREVVQVLDAIGSHPSLAVVCGSSEIEQQVAMLGLDPELARGEFFMSTVPALMRAAGVGVPYVPSAPTGGELPFRTDRGVANYFGVGAYLRPFEDVRRAEVKFASECLAFANVPDEDVDDRAFGVMRDVGADWDFADVRDHYLRLLHGRGPADVDYWPWSRVVTGEVMATVFGEWRRAGSSCGGGIVLWSRDLTRGAGWGLLDTDGRPKVAWHALRRVLSPIAVWFVDEGLNGLRIHVGNDGPTSLAATLRIAVYRADGAVVATEAQLVEVPPHSTIERDAEASLGFFADLTYAYRFGTAQHDVVVASLERTDAILSQAFFYPASSPGSRTELGSASLEVRLRVQRDGDQIDVALSSEQLVRCVRLHAAGYEPEDDAFDLEPGRPRVVALHHVDRGLSAALVHVDALNVEAPIEAMVA
jgi:beta-mannosidase